MEEGPKSNRRTPKSHNEEIKDRETPTIQIQLPKNKAEFFKIKEALNESSQDNTPKMDNKSNKEERSWDLKG